MCRFIAVALILAAPAVAGADSIDDFIDVEMKKQKIPGLAVAVVKDGKVVKAQGYGLANLEHQVPVKRETIFQSGSVGKQFTAMAAMVLVDDGKMKLDDPVSKYLPGTPEAWKDITVRHLLTHTAGIKEYTSVLDLRKDYSEDELLKAAYKFPLDFPPGEKWRYSNTGYAVLGILISKVAGKFYGDFLKERVFAPLGMKTARIINEADVIPNRAAGYRTENNEWKNQSWVSPTMNTTADGSLYLTLDDLIQWDAGLTAGKLLKKESYDLMWTPVKTKDGKDSSYGFGWMIGTENGHKRIHHGGAWQGFTSYIDRYPDDKLTIIVLANLGAPRAQPGKFASVIAARMIPDLAAKKNGEKKDQ